MARGLRVDGPGLLHHVTARGVERRAIFLDDHDRWDMLRRLSRLIPELGFGCFGWVFMGNHVHFVLQTGLVGLPKLMARLGTGYALAFNRRHARVGHLWQDRYWSRPLEGDADRVVTYVHENPERAGLVAAGHGDRYEWSGCAWIAGRRKPLPFERGFPRSIVAPPRPAARSAEPSERERVEECIDFVCSARGISADRLRSGLRSPDLHAARVEVARVAAFQRRISQRAIAEALCVNAASVSRWLRK